MAHWRAILPASHFLEVDYEAVVEDVEREARRMLNYLDLPWDEAVLRFHETERPVRTASVNQVREPIYRTSAGRWRKHAAQLQSLLSALDVRSG
jgi:Sulfotransferase family